MQTVAQSINDVSYVTGTPRNRVNQFARALVSAGIFPKSVGRDVKKIDGGQLLGLIAAVAFAENVADAPAVARNFMTLPVQSGDGFDGGDETLAQVFGACLDYPEWAAATLTLSVVPAGYTANLDGEVVCNGKVVVGYVPFFTSPSMGGWAKRSFSIHKTGVEILRNLFRREYEGDDGMEYKLAGVKSPE
ncbi:hypothetical protein [Sphingomonas echinoides]|uniref:hypothetical protein n=1 Tax=Sphingomonas echinoides TaxID=59803 RepID=UPI0024136B1E|nr:hypothetical protein [Sphingomonas echinoides]